MRQAANLSENLERATRGEPERIMEQKSRYCAAFAKKEARERKREREKERKREGNCDERYSVFSRGKGRLDFFFSRATRQDCAHSGTSSPRTAKAATIVAIVILAKFPSLAANFRHSHARHRQGGKLQGGGTGGVCGGSS